MVEISGEEEDGGGCASARLLVQAPALVQELMLQFQWRFLDADLSGKGERDGGDGNGDGVGDGVDVYRRLGGAVVAWLGDKGLSRAEMLYAVVAALRTVKVGLAVLTGADTRMLPDIFEKDVQVHLV